MKTKYVCYGLIYLHTNFHDNWTMWTVVLIIKNCSWRGGLGVGGKKSLKLVKVTISFNYKNLQMGGGEEKEPAFHKAL